MKRYVRLFMFTGCLMALSFVEDLPLQSNNWVRFNGSAVELGVGADGTVWALDPTPVGGGYRIKRWDGNAWETMPGGAMKIAVGSADHLWIVNDAMAIYRWTGTDLEEMPGAAMDIGVGADGTVWIIGTNKIAGGYDIYKWVGEAGATVWEKQPGAAMHISVGSASYIAIVDETDVIYRWDGHCKKGNTIQAFRWQNNLLTGLQSITAVEQNSSALATSDNGAVVVGNFRSAEGLEAFRWEGSTVIGFGDLPGTSFYSEAWAISGDGSIVVGASSGANLIYTDAFIWDAESGMRNLNDLLKDVYGIETELKLTRVEQISSGGLTMAGTARNQQAATTQWILKLPWYKSAASGVAAAPEQMPHGFSLQQNYPNPFNAGTMIRYELPQAAHVKLKIYNALGKLVRVLVQGRQNAGSHAVQWQGHDDFGRIVASGLYLVSLESGPVALQRKILFLK